MSSGSADAHTDSRRIADDTDPGSRVVFVGGTGRSGTHVLAELLGRHSRLADVPIEARFHCNKRGMPALLSGRVTLEAFLTKLRDFWWHRVRVDGQPRGLYNLMRRAEFDSAVDRFRLAYEDDPVGACRGLFLELLEPVAQAAGKSGLVEMSSHNIREAQALRRMFPEARFIHVVRDGRDSAASVTSKTWGPGNVIEAIDWWADRLRLIEDGVRSEEDGAEFTLPPDRFSLILLDDLVAGDREPAYTELLEFLGLEDERAMRDFFEQRMSPDAAHQGRWRKDLGPLGRARVGRKYERTLADLEREGNHAAPALIGALGRT